VISIIPTALLLRNGNWHGHAFDRLARILSGSLFDQEPFSLITLHVIAARNRQP